MAESVLLVHPLKSPEKKRPPNLSVRLPRLVVLAGILLILSAASFLSSLPALPHVSLHANSKDFQGPALTVVTLLFAVSHLSALTPEKNELNDTAMVEHNCAFISGTRHHFIIYTDDLSSKFCRHCECRQFIPSNCHRNCADPSKHACNHCEKLLFVRDALQEYGEFVFLDSDLVIAKDDFLDRLSIRSRAHDFLATYGFSPDANLEKYTTRLNSGMFFIRRVPGLDYSGLSSLMQEMRTNSDQTALSEFIFTHYENWDSLSRRWNCRMSFVRRTEFPVKECYTLHGRNGIEQALRQQQKTLLLLG